MYLFFFHWRYQSRTSYGNITIDLCIAYKLWVYCNWKSHRKYSALDEQYCCVLYHCKTYDKRKSRYLVSTTFMLVSSDSNHLFFNYLLMYRLLINAFKKDYFIHEPFRNPNHSVMWFRISD